MSRAIAFLTVLFISLTPLAADRNKAAEYFALAQAAEKRSDWEVAVRNYQLAYETSAHADVLFNIALNYERLGRNRDAARYLTQFEKESDSDAEKSKARTKAKELREKSSKVRFTSKPVGAEVSLDGVAIGTTPLERDVEPGPHVATAKSADKKAPVRELMVEYGEPLTIDFEFGGKKGTLSVNATVDDAEVMIDGVGVGKVPYVGSLPSGTHTVLVSAPGYKTVSRDINVPADGSEQITAQLSAIDKGAGAKPAPKLGPLGFLAGFGLGVSGGSDANASPRAMVELGMRTRTQRFDFVATYGGYGARVGLGYGVATRMYLRGGLFRPYIRGAVIVGSVDDDDSQSTRSIGGEGGVGLRYIGRATTSASLEYFVEINLQVASADTEAPPEPGMGGQPLLAPTAALRLSFPVTLGLAYRFGARR